MADILIVDDNPRDCELLVESLRREGHGARCLPNGRDALGSMVNHPPDLVVTDVFMPEMDGVTFLEIVRAYLRFREIPVVVVSGFPEGIAVDRLRELGVSAVVEKDTGFLFKAMAAIRGVLSAAGVD